MRIGARRFGDGERICAHQHPPVIAKLRLLFGCVSFPHGGEQVTRVTPGGGEGAREPLFLTASV